MRVTMRGGPLDGQEREIEDETLTPEHPIFLPPDAPRGADAKHEDDIPGDDDLVEYIYRGEGLADYVSGLVDGSEV